MIEEIVINYLTERGFDVYAEVPVNPSRSYVVIQRSSGNYTNQIRHIGMYTESRSRNSKLEAARIHEAVIEAMRDIRNHTEIFRCELNADYDAAMTSTKEYRYQALWDITV